MSGIAGFDPDRFVRKAEATAEVVQLRPIRKEWEHGLSLLRDLPVPPGALEPRWRQIIGDATKLATIHQDDVIAAGWSIEDLFGFDLEQANGHLSLAVIMRGRKLLRIDASEAVVKSDSGLVFHHPHMPVGSTLLWNFDRQKRRK